MMSDDAGAKAMAKLTQICTIPRMFQKIKPLWAEAPNLSWLHRLSIGSGLEAFWSHPEDANTLKFQNEIIQAHYVT
jgi:hypothetical protein